MEKLIANLMFYGLGVFPLLVDLWLLVLIFTLGKKSRLLDSEIEAAEAARDTFLFAKSQIDSDSPAPADEHK